MSARHPCEPPALSDASWGHCRPPDRHRLGQVGDGALRRLPQSPALAATQNKAWQVRKRTFYISEGYIRQDYHYAPDRHRLSRGRQHSQAGTDHPCGDHALPCPALPCPALPCPARVGYGTVRS